MISFISLRSKAFITSVWSFQPSAVHQFSLSDWGAACSLSCIEHSLFVTSLLSAGRGWCEGGSDPGKVEEKEESFILITRTKIYDYKHWVYSRLAVGMIYGNVGNNQPITPYTTPAQGNILDSQGCTLLYHLLTKLFNCWRNIQLQCWCINI